MRCLVSNPLVPCLCDLSAGLLSRAGGHAVQVDRVGRGQCWGLGGAPVLVSP